MDARTSPGMTEIELQKGKGLRDTIAQPFNFSTVKVRPQNIKLSLTSTQRPFWICCTWVTVLAR